MSFNGSQINICCKKEQKMREGHLSFLEETKGGLTEVRDGHGYKYASRNSPSYC